MGKKIIIMKPFRYIVSHEFYGALIYDKEEDSCIAIDEDFYNLLAACVEEGDFSAVDDEETMEFLTNEGFSDHGVINYRIFDSEHEELTLSSPSRIHFYYTSKCNLNCSHCFTKNAKEAVFPDMTYEEKLRMLDQMEELGIYEILIGGGEPFTEPDFPDFVEECLRRGIVTKVFTNGTLLDETMIDRISQWDLKYLSVSIDGATREEYRIMRGIDGLDNVLDNIRRLSGRCRYPIAVSITVGSYNYNKPVEYLQLINSLGVERIKVRPIKPSGNIMINRDFFADASQYAHFIRCMQKEWLDKYKERFRIDYSWGDARLYYDEKQNCMEIVNIPYPYEGYGCFAGKASMVIDSRGNATPCGFLPPAMQFRKESSLSVHTLKEIWDKGRNFTALRNQKGNPVCLNCRYFPSCRGGCIARILFVGRKMNDVDPWCPADYFPLYIGD